MNNQHDRDTIYTQGLWVADKHCVHCGISCACANPHILVEMSQQHT